MADSNIGALPQVQGLYDDSMLVVEQQGQAMKVSGAQFKEFGRQAVIGQVQGYVDQAEEAADKAAGAVSAVTGMTVEAHTLETGQEATVAKSMKDGVYNLAFGLPRGKKGDPGKDGGPGPKGDPGTGLRILEYYDTPDDLRAAVKDPEAGDAYGVGAEPPYDIYVFDGGSGDWKNNGPLSGGGVIPENVVTADGGASIEVEGTFDGAPHVITITDEEEPPLTAEDIEYGNKTVKEALNSLNESVNGLFTSVSDGKALIASAVTDKGVNTAPDAAFAKIAENIRKIATGTDTQDATAAPGDILSPKTAYTASGKVTGVIPSLAAKTYTPSVAAQTIANGQYLSGTQTIKGDTNLVSSNIRKGVSIFGVNGAMESDFKATLTVKADIGAVVTATCGDTSVEALSTTGAVVLELPIEGTWKVTAVRGMAQYNTVTLEVSSSYNAELTAEVHIEYYVTGTPLSAARYNLAATAVGNYVLFCGGMGAGPSSSDSTVLATVDAYNASLTRSTPIALARVRHNFAATTIGSYALIAGGVSNVTTNTVEVYDASLTRLTPGADIEGRYNLAATTVGNYALFGGGGPYVGYTDTLNTVDAYNVSLTRITPTPLTIPRTHLAATTVGNYALFGGGLNGNTSDATLDFVDAYNASLTRSAPTPLSQARSRLSATAAGNYALFAGGTSSAGSSVVDAYDLFLTRSTPETLSVGRHEIAATSLNGYALFAGGMTSSDLKTSPTLDAYDPYLTHTIPASLKKARYYHAAAVVGNYALIGGGLDNNGNANKLDSVEIYRYV